MRLATSGALAVLAILAAALLPGVASSASQEPRTEDRLILPNTLPADEQPAATRFRTRTARAGDAKVRRIATLRDGETRLASVDLPAAAASR